jgi:hypothetical protein
MTWGGEIANETVFIAVIFAYRDDFLDWFSHPECKDQGGSEWIGEVV